jgi:hypothetical protein
MIRTRIAAIVIAAIGILGSSPAVAQTQPPPFYMLLPFDWPGTLIRTCSTQYGVCAIPHTVQPGTPCYCQAANGTWLPGVCTR